MSDYIMNRESLKRHCEIMCERFKGVPTSGTYGEHRLVLDLLEQTEWIPISERLPEKGKQVLCCNKSGSVFTSAITYINSNGMVAFGQHYEVIAWMPLPEPYRQESEVQG